MGNVLDFILFQHSLYSFIVPFNEVHCIKVMNVLIFKKVTDHTILRSEINLQDLNAKELQVASACNSCSISENMCILNAKIY